MAQTTTDVAAPQNIGQQVYQSVCIACHDTGVAHAPKFGDRSAWEPLVAEGQSVLTGHAWVGVRAMPAPSPTWPAMPVQIGKTRIRSS
ncbi:c-type cytochrome [Giesbergeria sp.]|uniref:c-type cytochrome n=1 Tax=Giesbergeria sp. TaxID=2818473 RepID=UPI0026138A13|nr:c-type cytochrome [Giesbergeria sp.]